MTEKKEMASRAKITIIVPVYNVERELTRCMESIINQTYTYLQIILVDDGSTDGSGGICDFYAERDKRIEVFHTENRGLVAARKLGLRASNGEYIGFVDGDDYIEADMFEIMLREISKSHADFVHTGFIQEKDGCHREILGFEAGVYELRDLQEREKFLNRYVLDTGKGHFISYSIWSKLYRSNLIKSSYSLLQDRQQYGEDLLSLCLCILHSKRISLCRYALYHYVVKEKSMSHLQDKEYAIKEVELYGNVAGNIYNYDRNIYKSLEKYIYSYIMRKLMVLMERMNSNIKIPRFYFRNIESLIGKEIVIYGAGVVGRDYYAQFSKYKEIEIVAWIDSNWENIRCEYTKIYGIDRLNEYKFEKIIIAVSEEKMAEEIRNKLMEYDQPDSIIVWDKPQNIVDGEWG